MPGNKPYVPAWALPFLAGGLTIEHDGSVVVDPTSGESATDVAVLNFTTGGDLTYTPNATPDGFGMLSVPLGGDGGSGVWSKNGNLGSDEVLPSEIAPGAGIAFQCETDGQPLTISANLTAGSGIQLDTSETGTLEVSANLTAGSGIQLDTSGGPITPLTISADLTAGSGIQLDDLGGPLTISANLTAGSGIQLDYSGEPITISVANLKTSRDENGNTYYEYLGYVDIPLVAYNEADIVLPQAEWLPPGSVTSDSAYWGHTAYIEIEIVGTDGVYLRFRKLYWAMLRRGTSGDSSWETDTSPQEDTAQARGTMSGGLTVTLDRNGENDADLTFGFIYEYADVGGNESPKGTWTIQIRILGAGRYE